MAIGECGVCGAWWSGSSLPSGNKRADGTTPLDNFVCFRCQEEARQQRDVDRPVNRQQRRRRAA